PPDHSQPSPTEPAAEHPVATMAGSADPAADAGSRAERRTIRVPAEKIDVLLDLVGETVLHRQRLEHELAANGDAERQIADELDLGEQLLDELQNAAIGMRTLPLSTIVSPLPRAVRDLAVETG